MEPYQDGVQHLKDCTTYGFGVADKFERIFLMGYESFDPRTNEPHSVLTRKAMRADAKTAGL